MGGYKQIERAIPTDFCFTPLITQKDSVYNMKLTLDDIYKPWKVIFVNDSKEETQQCKEIKTQQCERTEQQCEQIIQIGFNEKYQRTFVLLPQLTHRIRRELG